MYKAEVNNNMLNNRCLIVVSSSFQLLGAQKVASNLNLVPFYILTVNPNDPRAKTLENYAINNKLPYRLINKHKYNWIKLCFLTLLKCLIPNSSKYSKVIIGDYFDQAMSLIAIQNITRSAYVCFVDDGTSTFDLNKNYISRHFRFNYKVQYYFRNIISFLMRIKLRDHYTIFNTDNDLGLNLIQYNLFNKQNNAEQKGIYLLGTNIPAYCNYNHITPDAFYKKFNQVISTIKTNHPEGAYFYSPHPREKDENILKLCRDNDFTIVRSKYTVEIDYVESGVYPSAIYGFHSTGELTLKMLFPMTDVSSIILKENKVSSPDQEVRWNKVFIESGINIISL